MPPIRQQLILVRGCSRDILLCRNRGICSENFQPSWNQTASLVHHSPDMAILFIQLFLIFQIERSIVEEGILRLYFSIEKFSIHRTAKFYRKILI